MTWRLNIRISGCVFNGKSKGWIYFFSEITDEKILHELDHFVSKLCSRFNVQIELKSFVRSFFQVKHNRLDTTYIPNFDKYDIDQKEYVLNHFFGKNTENMTDKEITYQFNIRISKQVKDIESDLKRIGY